MYIRAALVKRDKKIFTVQEAVICQRGKDKWVENYRAKGGMGHVMGQLFLNQVLYINSTTTHSHICTDFCRKYSGKCF